MNSQPALLLINYFSRSGRDKADTVRQLLRERHIRFIEPEDTQADITTQIEKNHKNVSLAVIAGGDGTVNAASGSLLKTGLPFAILPLGTANDLSRSLDIPEGLADACDVIADGQVRKINLGKVNGRYFFNVANIGYGVEVNRQLSPTLKKWLGPLSYAIAALTAAYRKRPVRATLHYNGTSKKVHAVQIAVGNGCFYGGGLKIHSDAQIDSNLLYVYLIQEYSALSVISRMSSFREGRMEDIEGVETFTTEELTIKSSSRRTIMADGEKIGKTPATFSQLTDALEVLVPHKSGQSPSPENKDSK